MGHAVTEGEDVSERGWGRRGGSYEDWLIGQHLEMCSQIDQICGLLTGLHLNGVLLNTGVSPIGHFPHGLTFWRRNKAVGFLGQP